LQIPYDNVEGLEEEDDEKEDYGGDDNKKWVKTETGRRRR
jgi:hypothetical protein